MGTAVRANRCALSRVGHDLDEGLTLAKRLARRPRGVQARVNEHIAAPDRNAIAVDDAQRLLVIEQARPGDQLTTRRKGERA